MNVEKVINGIYEDAKKIYKSKKNKRLANELQKDIDLFFGPSKLFIPIFKNAIMCIAQQDVELQEKIKS